MLKSIISRNDVTQSDQPVWLDLVRIARAEITSENDLFPIEHALGQAISTGWRSADPGPQVIRLVFEHPIDVRRIYIHVIERAAERTQEFALYAETADRGLHEVRRQQFTFSPHGSTEEIEDFTVDLRHLKFIELRIDPDRSHKPSASQNYASLSGFKLA